jgi:WD40 repeat protein
MRSLEGLVAPVTLPTVEVLMRAFLPSKIKGLVIVALLLAGAMPAQAALTVTSPDGRYRATATGSTIIIRSARSGRGLARLDHYPNAPVTALAFAPNGQTLVSGDRAGNVWMWQPDYSGRPRTTVEQLRWRSLTNGSPVMRVTYGTRTVLVRTWRGGPFLLDAQNGTRLPLHSIPTPPGLR